VVEGRGESGSRSHAQSIVGRRSGGVLGAQLRRPAATAAGHPPLAASAAAAVVYVSRHPCTYTATALRKRRPNARAALPPRSITRRRRSARISHCGARVVFVCSFVSCSPHQSRARRCDQLSSSTRAYRRCRPFFRFPVESSTDSESTLRQPPPTPLHCPLPPPPPPPSQRLADRRHCSRRRRRRRPRR